MQENNECFDYKYEIRYRHKNIKAVIRGIIEALSIISLLIYGVELARMGINHDIALAIGVIIGGIGGYSIKELRDIYKSEVSGK